MRTERVFWCERSEDMRIALGGGTFSIDERLTRCRRIMATIRCMAEIVGFNKKVWKAREIDSKDTESLELTYLSPDGEEDFREILSVKVVFTLPRDRNELRIDYTSMTDKDTVLNLSNHSYFNLAGEAMATSWITC